MLSTMQDTIISLVSSAIKFYDSKSDCFTACLHSLLPEAAKEARIQDAAVLVEVICRLQNAMMGHK